MIFSEKLQLLRKNKGVTQEELAEKLDVSRQAVAKFYAVRMLQTGLGKADPEYTDYKYWKSNGWIDKTRPWR